MCPILSAFRRISHLSDPSDTLRKTTVVKVCDESLKIMPSRTKKQVTSLQKYKSEGNICENQKINKMDPRRAVFVLCLVVFVALIDGQGFAPAGQISEACFNCLCEASSECDLYAECVSKGPGQYHCGPYQISYDYWKDGGKPGENADDPLDFERCLNSKPCAEAAIRGYMHKWATDCDGDMDIDCFDWSRIHKSGPYGCNSTWVINTDYWARFENCMSKQ